MRAAISSALGIRTVPSDHSPDGLADVLALPTLSIRHCKTVMKASLERTASPPGALDAFSLDSNPQPFLFGHLPYDMVKLRDDTLSAIRRMLTFSHRALIYELLLTRTYALEIGIFSLENSTIPPAILLDHAHLNPVVLRINKAICNEALPCLYSHNTFSFDNLDDCRAFTDPTIAGRALMTRISLPRMAMSRPICRWKTLHHVLPLELQHLSIEIDTYHTTLLEICERLRRGLRIFLANIKDANARRTFFNNKIRIRIRSLKHLKKQVQVAQSEEYERPEHKAQWERVAASLDVGHAAVERSFKDLIGTGLVCLGG